MPSIVYHLWARLRLEEVILWQESWAHPLAFGFRRNRGSLDGAVVTQLLLELCRLRGWVVAGMSIDYKKFIYLIPQAIMLRVAAELGLAPDICRAIGAMYRHHRRSFKIGGCLGLWWQATNGILLGCPPSVILVNVLMGIWKEEIDSLRQQVCIWTRALPPVRRLLPAVNPEDPLEVVLRDAGRGYVALGAQGWANNTEAVAPGMGPLQRTIPATERWLRLSGQCVNVAKSTSFLEGSTTPPRCSCWGPPSPGRRSSNDWGWAYGLGAGGGPGQRWRAAWTPSERSCCGHRTSTRSIAGPRPRP